MPGKEKRMADLEKPITTQEDLDALLESDRAEQSKKYDGWMSPEEVSKKYEGWESPDAVNSRVTDLQSKIDTLTAQAEKDSQKYKDLDTQLQAEKSKSHGYEIRFLKQKAARDIGLSIDFADRLTGEKEEDIRKDAENFKKTMDSQKKPIPPLANFDDKTKRASSASLAWDEMLNNLKGE